MLAAIIATVYIYLQSLIAPKQTVFVDPLTQQEKNIKSFGFQKLKSKFAKGTLAHVSVLGALLFILFAVRHALGRYSVMYSSQGIVVGAGYSDIVAYLFMVKVLIVVALIFAAIFMYSAISKKVRKHPFKVFGQLFVLYFVLVIVGTALIPWFVQTFIVAPNEIALEKPYIAHNINFTRLAYGIDSIQEQNFAFSANTSRSLDRPSQEAIDNVRILDWRPLTQTYKQTQEIRLYYDLSGIDLDRYHFGSSYEQVMLAPRELDQKQITSNAQTWVNLHLVYTHGYGVVMSPVNKVTSQGLPEYYLKDIPPIVTKKGAEEILAITHPQIYYGEKRTDFVIVNTNTPEFDYPKGNTNEYLHYDGTGGVTLNTFWKKLVMAVRFKDIKILLSTDISAESKIQFTRHIQDRIKTITPFLLLDADPYLVIANGKLYWIQDAYTVTNYYPYAEKYGKFNYLRNSVKVVIDAYDGSVSYYIADPSDPLIITAAKIFPKQFRLLESMPEGLKAHLRYPEDLFKVQAALLNTYHMEDPTVFYNKEDAWQIPNEVYGVGEQIPVEPYYMIMNLPGEVGEEFVLMTSFTPIRKDNMIGWLAARMDGEHYGKLMLYKFPKDKLIYGPLQIEARIDQDSEISQQLTLWSQQGSRVTRGNLLVIPLKESVLYVEPLYIQAEQGQLPELKRIIISDGEYVVMETSLAEALQVLFGHQTSEEQRIRQENATIDDRFIQAQEIYNDLLAALEEQNWADFGTYLDELGTVLEE